jgi:hypothetical protein
MSARFHGVTSIGLVVVAMVIAAVVLFQVSWVVAVVYLVGCAVSAAGIVYAFCAKCPCRRRCAHVVFGKLAVAFTNREEGPYTGIELAVVGLALLWLLGFPQIWLWRYAGLLVAFWVLNAISVVQIRLAVCPACGNAHCPLKARGRVFNTPERSA